MVDFLSEYGRRLAFFLLVLIPCLGHIRNSRDQIKIFEHQHLLNEVISKFSKFSHEEGIDEEAYKWLIQRSTQIENQLGLNEFISLLTQIKNSFEIVSDININTSKDDARNHLLRKKGDLDDEMKNIRNNEGNIFCYFRLGVNELVSFPFYLLGWLGVITPNMINHLTNNKLASFIPKIFTLLSIIAAVMTLILGWDDFINLVWPS